MNKNYLIIEDEKAAYQLLKSHLEGLRPDAEIIGPIQTVDDAIEYFEKEKMPDMVFMDIHLSDGSSFDIFDNVEVTCPIVFTTAYEEYALKAFEVNSIDYLLKPIDRQKLEHALDKRELLSPERISEVKEAMREVEPSTHYKTCLLIHHRDKVIPVPTSEIAIIWLSDQIIKLRTFKNESYYLNTSLEETFSKLNPALFYRANRQQIISRKAVKELTSWFNNTISVSLTIPTEERIIIRKPKVKEFKKWLTDN